MVTFTHVCFTVLDMEKTVRFYDEQVGLKAIREWWNPDRTEHLVYLNDGNLDFTLELCEKVGRTEPYNVGEQAYHLAVVAENFEEMHAKHAAQGMICRDIPELGVYFIQDPDNHLVEIMKNAIVS